MLNLQVAQIYKDPSVGNPVSVAVVKVEILKVRKAHSKISIQDVWKRVVLNYIMSLFNLILWDVSVTNKIFLETNCVLTWSIFLLLNILVASFFCFLHLSYFLFLFSSCFVAISLASSPSWMFPQILFLSFIVLLCFLILFLSTHFFVSLSLTSVYCYYY